MSIWNEIPENEETNKQKCPDGQLILVYYRRKKPFVFTMIMLKLNESCKMSMAS